MNYYGYDIIRESDLKHYGILGMKWGVRRYQNEDGSLTKVGARRYSRGKRIKNLDVKALHQYQVNENERLRKEAAANELAKALKTYKNDKDQWYTIHQVIKNSVENDKKLSELMTEAAKLDLELEHAAAEWSSDKEQIYKTATAYVAQHRKERHADYYLNLEGIDAAADVWSFYVDNTPELKSKSDKIWDIRTSFESASEQYYQKYLGAHAEEKALDGTAMSTFMARENREKFFDLLENRKDIIWRTS